MFIYIHQMLWRGRPCFTLFIHGYRRPYRKRITISPVCKMIEATPEEIGQLLGGN